MAKTRKKRDYGSMFKSSPSAALPTPDEINKQVANLVEKSPVPPVVAKEPEVTPTAPTKPEAKATPTDTKPEAPTSAEATTRGRKPLEVRRVPYTTSLTEDQKFNLKYHAMRKGIRPSDMLHAILEDYFRNNPI